MPKRYTVHICPDGTRRSLCAYRFEISKLHAEAADRVADQLATATAYSASRQLVTTAFNITFAVILICIVFGWSGGSKLVKDSYSDAKEQAADRKGRRKHRDGEEQSAEA
jgi:hypothetical protein